MLLKERVGAKTEEWLAGSGRQRDLLCQGRLSD